MFEKLEKRVNEINDKLESVEFISPELQGKFYKLENELEEEVRFSFENEKGKFEKLLKKLRNIKTDNDIQ